MLEYPKIETLYERDAQHRVISGRLRRPEFALIREWLLTEKLDGTNVRVILDRVPGAREGQLGDAPTAQTVVRYAGRTDAAQLPGPLLSWLQTCLPVDVVAGAFDADTRVVLFGEGYGAGIQRGGAYRLTPAFRLFDVAVVSPERTWWLDWENIGDVACKLKIRTVPVIGVLKSVDLDIGEVDRFVREFQSPTAAEHGMPPTPAEGVVARTDPPLFMRNGAPLRWKLKRRDFGGSATVADRGA